MGLMTCLLLIVPHSYRLMKIQGAFSLFKSLPFIIRKEGIGNPRVQLQLSRNVYYLTYEYKILNEIEIHSCEKTSKSRKKKYWSKKYTNAGYTKRNANKLISLWKIFQEGRFRCTVFICLKCIYGERIMEYYYHLNGVKKQTC